MAGAQTATVGSLDWPDWLGKKALGPLAGPSSRSILKYGSTWGSIAKKLESI